MVRGQDEGGGFLKTQGMCISAGSCAIIDGRGPMCLPKPDSYWTL